MESTSHAFISNLVCRFAIGEEEEERREKSFNNIENMSKICHLL